MLGSKVKKKPNMTFFPSCSNASGAIFRLFAHDSTHTLNWINIIIYVDGMESGNRRKLFDYRRKGSPHLVGAG